MIKAVIFDFDGLLADTEIISFQIYKEILNRYGHDYSKEDYSKSFSGKPEKENVRKLISDYDLPLTFDECFDFVIKTEKELFEKGVKLKFGAEYLLKYLKDNGYKIAIASSSTRQRAMKILKQHHIDHYFDTFVFAEDIFKGKPDPQIFLKTAEKLKTDPSECLVLEDSESGIQAANNAKMTVICIPDMKRPSDKFIKMASTLCSDLSDVVLYLNLKNN